jgi:hypothetical protein
MATIRTRNPTISQQKVGVQERRNWIKDRDEEKSVLHRIKSRQWEMNGK